MTSTIGMDIAKLLSQLELRDAQSQSDCLQRQLNSIGELRPDGRRLLGRSMTTTTSPKTPITTFFSEPLDDSPTEMPEVFSAHRKLDRSVSEPHPSILTTRGSPSQNGSCSSNSSSSSRYKTELCRPYEENGSCKYGEKCQFAHGRQELRSVARHPKYKTDLCKTYHTTGLCPYGPRCHFIHNDEERYLNLVNRYLLQQQMTDSLFEKAQLVRQQQVIAAALAAQKALIHPQQPNGDRRPASARQISTDEPRFQFPFMSTDPVSSSLSDSSSLTESPTPSPTSSMFSDDPTAALGGFGGAFQTPTGQGGFGFDSSDAKFLQTSLQQQRLQLLQQTEAMGSSALLLLMSKLQQQTEQQDRQQKLDALITYLVQNSSAQTTSISSSSCSAIASPSILSSSVYSSNKMSPYSPPEHLPDADFSTSRDNTCFSFAYPTVDI